MVGIAKVHANWYILDGLSLQALQDILMGLTLLIDCRDVGIYGPANEWAGRLKEYLEECRQSKDIPRPS